MLHSIAFVLLAVWFRGNLHTHTLASDGDSAPEAVVQWYREHGYQFLVITDHDKITIVDGGGLLLIHHLQSCDADAVKPGQAWIVVRAETLDEASILDAMKRGDFYASTGVEIESYDAVPIMTVKIAAQPGARYTTTFIGRGGRVLARTTDNPATYRIKGNEGYVRAKVIDSNGKAAWLQPAFTSAARPSR